MAFFDDIGKKISDVGQSTIQKGKEMADIAKYNSLISEEEKKISVIYGQIGKQYAELYSEFPEEPFAPHIAALKASIEKVEDYKKIVVDLRGVSKCPACGAEVPTGTLFCAICGTQMNTQTSNTQANSTPTEIVQRCSDCGAAIPPGSKFCTSCGKPTAEGNMI